EHILDGIAALAVLIWLYLLLGRGMFWLGRERDDVVAPAPSIWPRIVAVIPARNEAEGIGETIASLLRQDYPGGLGVILVDDESTDAPAEVARGAAAALNQQDRLQVISGRALPRGWTGKLWAVKQGIAVADALAQPPDYLLLTDADIVYSPDAVR